MSAHLDLPQASAQVVLKKINTKVYLQASVYNIRGYFLLAQGQLEKGRSFLKFILFSDESIFNSNDGPSSQNRRWWATENSQFTVETNNQY